jgi:hypothetical protein
MRDVITTSAAGEDDGGRQPSVPVAAKAENTVSLTFVALNVHTAN